MPEEFLAPIHRKKIRHRQVSLAAAPLGCVILLCLSVSLHIQGCGVLLACRMKDFGERHEQHC